MTSPVGGFDPQPCCPGGDVTPLAAAFNYEQLCDVDPNTGIVYNVVTQQTQYDDEGQPVGMTYWDATTGEPYEPVGQITSCALTAGTQIEVLCEFTTGGDVVQFIRRYTELEDGSILVQDASLDGDQTYDVDPSSTIGVCPQVGGCDPLTVTGLCLPAGSPIAAVVRRDCDTGAVTLDGYLELLTGVFTAGTPPVGTVACGGENSIQVSGTFCSVDDVSGAVLALVLVEYTYGPDGAIESTRLVNAVDASTYVVPAGASITTCPAGVDSPESDGLALCDDNGVFLRDFRRDENGTLVSYSDYTLTLTPYVPVGAVRLCQPDEDPILVAQVCLANGHAGAVIRNADNSYVRVDTVTGLPFVVGDIVPCAPEPGCCPIAVTEVCLSNGDRGVIIRDEAGTLTRINTITGAAFVVGDIVPCQPFTNTAPVVLCYQGPGGTDDVRRFVRLYSFTASGGLSGYVDRTLDGTPVTVAPGAAFACPNAGARPQTYAEAFSVVPGTPWTYASLLNGFEADSVTVTVLTGTVTVDGSGTAAAVTLPAGVSMTWTRAPGAGRLVGPTSITAAAASSAVVHYTASLALP